MHHQRELSLKAKLSIYQSIYVSTFTYVHELWLVTVRKRLWIQEAEIHLREIPYFSLRNRERSSAIREL